MKFPGIYVEIRGDYTKLQHDLKQASGEVKVLAGEMSNALNNALTPGQVSGGINGLTSALAVASRAAKSSQQDFKQFGEQVKHLAPLANMTEKEFAGLQARMLKFKTQKAADKAFADIQRAAGLTNKELAALRTRMGDAAGAARVLAQASGTTAISLRSMFGSLAGPFSALAIAYTLRNLGREAVDTTIRIQGMEVALGAVLGGASASRKEMEWLRGTVKTLGLDLLQTGEAFKLISASAIGTSITQSQVRDVFSAVSESAVVLGLTSEDTRLVLLALSQMISKGTVYSEELRRQMGDRMPGAFSLAAEAMGVTTRQLSEMLQKGEVATNDFLPKFSKVLHDLYGEAAAGTDLLVQAQNRLSTAWTNIMTLGEENRKAWTDAANALAQWLEKANEVMSHPFLRVTFAGTGSETATGTFGGQNILARAAMNFGSYVAGGGEAGALAREAEATEQEIGRARLRARAAALQSLSKLEGQAEEFSKNLDVNRIKRLENERDSALRALERARAGFGYSQELGGRTVQIGYASITEEDYQAQVKMTWDAFEARRAAIKTEAEKEAKSVERAAAQLRDIIASLDRMTDTGTEGQGRMARLNKEYGDFVAKLGEGNPEVQRFAEVIAFANEHLGYTPAEVAKANRAIEESIAALKEAEFPATYATSSLYLDRKALVQVEQEYRNAVRNGADEIVAARERDLKLAVLQRDAAQAGMEKERELAQEKLARRMELDILERESNQALLEASSDYAAGWRAGMRDVVSNADSGFTAMRTLATSASESVGDAFGDMFYKISIDGENAFDAIGNAAVNMLENIANAMYKMLGDQIASGLLGAAGGLFSSSGSASYEGVTLPRGYGSDGSGGVTWIGSALGNVFTGPDISALSGGVYDKPTYFGYDSHVRAFAKGGVLGEAGPEAVMPLTRGKDGKLGVKAEGEAAPTVIQNFNLSPGVPEAVQREVRKLMPYVQAQTISAIDERNQRGRRK